MSGGISPQGGPKQKSTSDSTSSIEDGKGNSPSHENGSASYGHGVPPHHDSAHDHGIPLSTGVEVFDLKSGTAPALGDRVLLSEATLSQLDPRVIRFSYDRHALKTGVVHLGAGNLSLSLVAKIFHDYAENNGPGAEQWGVCAVSLRSPGCVARLGRQDNLYTVIERDGRDNDRETVVGVIKQAIYVPPSDDAAKEALENYPDQRHSRPDEVLRQMTGADTKIISVTVTQNGYYLKNGELDLSHPDILHDLIHPHEPKTIIGYVVEAMRLRRELGVEPFAVVSFDNLPDNGKLIGKACARFAEQLYGNGQGSLAAFINDEGRFPVTMVDRITPNIPYTAFLGPKVVDQRPVMTEPFWHVVIQDWRLPAGNPTDWMPDWKVVGIHTPHDVTPYAKLKARMVNASHTVIASLGQRIGTVFVHELFQKPDFEQFMRDLMHHEFLPTLDRPAGLNIEKYIDATLSRFANPAMRDQVLRLAEEGTRKVPKYILPAIKDALEMNPSSPFNRLAVATASWMISAVTCKNEHGQNIEVKEQEHMKPRLEAMTIPHQLLEDRDIMGTLLPQIPAFRQSIERAIVALHSMSVLDICAEMRHNGGHIP